MELNIQLKLNNLTIFKNAKNKKIKVTSQEIKNVFKDRQIQKLKDYIFPYINIGKFNNFFHPIDLKTFRNLFFYCPICEKKMRNYSISYHIFQKHFIKAEKYLSQNEMANGCANLIEKEYKKIKNSLQNYGELATFFRALKIRRFNYWSYNAENMINEIKGMNIEKLYFNTSLNEVKDNLIKKLPLNKNKNKNMHYKENNLELLMFKNELKEINNE